MKGFVVYDSNFGNTKIVAESIARQLGGNVKAVSVRRIKDADLEGIDLLVVGSPINAWSPTSPTKKFLEGLGKDGLAGIKAAAFDTRLRSFASGDAAKNISRALKRAGAKIIAKPTGFYVKGTKGPLLEGETSRATDWADEIRSGAGL
ncbi:MAG: flavodoxin domain-containing protein [Candidatus Micrarchaeota archaeon]|nr:flavodoxin domain-containing protein [Candidatus Micrarchaeota archaeon]